VTAAIGTARVRLRDTVSSEWVKVSTLRAMLPLLGLAAVLAVGVGALLSAAAGGDFAALDPAAKHVFDPVATALSAMPYANVIVAAMAVTGVASEYANGMMRVTLTATPKRSRAFAAKLLVAAPAGLVAGVLFAAVAVAVGLRMMSARGVPTPGFFDGGVLAAILGAGVGTALIAILGTCMAFLVRRTSVGVTLTNVVAFLPGILYVLPVWWQHHVLAYLPTGATSSLAGTVAGRSAVHLSTGTAYGVVVCWAVILVAAAGTVLNRRDG
jgi:ABC-type transport system involved in multi-copper enzyme maturation permease subunit